ncbi:MAG: hypothetical protein JKX87_06290 [Cycloclasticus sp.]|nr:hypothetical protein [Cycloclasticus sp.]
MFKKDGIEKTIVVIEDYGSDLFGANLKHDDGNAGFYDLSDKIYTANRDLL